MPTGKGPPVRCRAAKACKACHQRRVKCDAVQKGLPCTRCEQNGIHPCCLIESKRGTYARGKSKQSGTAKGRQQERKGTQASEHSSTDEAAASAQVDSNDTILSPGMQNATTEDVPLDLIATPGSEAVPLNDHGILPPEVSSPWAGQRPDSHQEPETQLFGQGPFSGNSRRSRRKSSGLATSQQSHTSRGRRCNTVLGHDLSTPRSDLTDSTSSSYREISWTAMFDHFLDSRRRDGQDIIDKCSITYLGESFPLSMVLEDMEGSGKMKLHYPGPPVPGKEFGADPPSEQHPNYMRPDEIATLNAKGVFEYPSPETLDALLSTFLDRVYPIYPIVRRGELIEQVRERTIPWILLHAICFAAATFCPISVLHRANFSERQEARFHFYTKGKLLFDAGYEVNKVVMLQSTIFLALWAGGPNDFWNFYSWNSSAVTIAEALGMHRSMASTNMDQQDKSLLRRLWWVLVIRDASASALFGRPFRISMEFSDADMLTMADFEAEMASPEFADHPMRELFGQYQIHIARLSLILRQIVAARFTRRLGRSRPSDLIPQLQTWLKELPVSLRLGDGGEDQNPFAVCLSILYDHHLILASLDQAPSAPQNAQKDQQKQRSYSAGSHLDPPSRGHSSSTPAEGPNNSPTIDAAAQRILSLACGIVRRSAASSVPQEAYPGLFLAEVVFYGQTRSSDVFRAQLGQSALTTCQIAWQSIGDAWDSAPWVRRLFDNLAAQSQQATREPSVVNDAADVRENNTNAFNFSTGFGMPGPGTQDMTGMDVGFMPDMWQGHPILSTFFDSTFEWANPDPSLDSSYPTANFLANMPSL